MSGNFVVNAKSVKELAELLNDTGLSEIEYQVGEHRIRVAKTLIAAPMTVAPMLPAAPAPVAASVAAVEPVSTAQLSAGHPGALTSPMVGTAYLSPEPGAASFVKVGDEVKQGQTLMIIEAMKVMNPIRAPKNGKVSQILAKDATPVEFGEVLMIIE